MKTVHIHMDNEEYEAIAKVKKQNKHTWEQVLWAYADAYKHKQE
jgi:hypothetical protein